MPTATVLVPTHNHAETLPYAIRSVQRQSVEDFELFIVGDGVSEATRAAIADLAAGDQRIRFFDFPKGPRKGELHRHEALRSASGRFVAYLGDDDLWMSNHLATVGEILRDADFGHTLHVGINANGQLFGLLADLQNANYRHRMLAEPLFNRFDFTFGAHTLEAYRRLPEGWRPPPPACPWADLYVWRQFLAQPWCRARSAMIPTGVCTQTHLRPQLTNDERASELARLTEEMSAPDFSEFLWRNIAASVALQIISKEDESRSATKKWQDALAEAEIQQQALKSMEKERRRLSGQLKAMESERRRLSGQLKAVYASSSWLVTSPLRAARRMLFRTP